MSDDKMAPSDVKDPSAAPQTLEPPPEKPSDASRRTRIVISFWLLVLCLGVPIWWKTTTIYRANLPLDGMMQWAEGKVRLRDWVGYSCANAVRPVVLCSLYRYLSRPMRCKITKRRISCD